MRKKFIAVIISALMLVACVPFISGCSASLTYTLSKDETHYIASCSGSKSALRGELIIDSEYNGLPVTEIAQEGFRGTSITGLTIPASINEMGLAAFANCNLLTTVDFLSGSPLTEISQATFAYCGNLKNITLPQSVTQIGHLAFTDCVKLSSVDIPQSVKEIGYQSFYNCTSLSEINFPQGLETIGTYSFCNTALTEIIIPSTVADKQVPALDDEGNPKLDDNQNPVLRTVYGIGVAAFHTCEYLKKVVIMEGSGSESNENALETLNTGVFGYCTSLKEIYLPSTIKKICGHSMNGSTFIAGHAFHHCKNLTDVYFAGTQEQWLAVEVENKEYNESGATFNNDYLKNATKHYNSRYTA